MPRVAEVQKDPSDSSALKCGVEITNYPDNMRNFAELARHHLHHRPRRLRAVLPTSAAPTTSSVSVKQNGSVVLPRRNSYGLTAAYGGGLNQTSK